MKTNTSGRRNGLQFSLTAQRLVESAFIGWSAASLDSSPEFWAQPCELCRSWGKKPPSPPSPFSHHCLFCIPHAKTACVLRHQLCFTCLDLLGFPVLIILFGLDGWWLKYSAVKYSWYLSHPDTHIQVCLARETVFFMRFELVCRSWERDFFFFLLWSGVILPFYGVCIIASLTTAWTAPCPVMWRSRTTHCSWRGRWPTTWQARTSVTRPTASGLAPASWTSTSQVG